MTLNITSSGPSSNNAKLILMQLNDANYACGKNISSLQPTKKDH
jgi:hypothetical protein